MADIERMFGLAPDPEPEPEPESEMPAYVIIGKPGDTYYEYDIDFDGYIDVWPDPVPVDTDVDSVDDGYIIHGSFLF